MSAGGSPLDAPVDVVRGIGPRHAATLRSQLGIETVRDLIEHYPRRYEDLGDIVPLELARIGEPATLVGTIVDWSQKNPSRPRGKGRLRISEATVRDRGGGSTFKITFFNQPWRARQLPPGSVAAFSGKLENKFGSLRISTPRVQELGDMTHQRLVPVYPATERLPSHRLAAWIEAALDALPPFEDHLPVEIRAQHGLAELDRAVRAIHQPEDHADTTAARRRLVFDELFTLQVGLHWRRARLEADAVGVDNTPVSDGIAQRFVSSLPFPPPGAPTRAF
jgi:ATP-dependent DNA helicase RecG